MATNRSHTTERKSAQDAITAPDSRVMLDACPPRLTLRPRAFRHKTRITRGDSLTRGDSRRGSIALRVRRADEHGRPPGPGGRRLRRTRRPRPGSGVGSRTAKPGRASPRALEDRGGKRSSWPLRILTMPSTSPGPQINPVPASASSVPCVTVGHCGQDWTSRGEIFVRLSGHDGCPNARTQVLHRQGRGDRLCGATPVSSRARRIRATA